jgi:hypothetical protein
MNSATVPSFWKAYGSLDTDTKRRAKKAFRLWEQNPFHPSFQFKCINRTEDIWSARITRGVRAIGTLDAGTVTWFWIGGHDDYRRFFS